MPEPTVPGLPPTTGINDPAMRAFADALSAAWATRNSSEDDHPERFVRRSEIEGLSAGVIARLLVAVADPATLALDRSGAPTNPTQVYEQAVATVRDLVLKSRAYQLLTTPVSPIARPTNLSPLYKKLGEASADLLEERGTRVAKDNSLAQAVNTLWAAVGGSQALIQDAALAAVTPAAVQATKWQQVQAAVTDPNTGQVVTTAIKQQLDAYISKADGSMNTTWAIRANTNGAISGVSLMTTTGAGSAPGAATSLFLIMANRLALVNPSNTSQTPVPFSVDSSGNAVFTGTIFAAGGVFGGSLSAGTNGFFGGALQAATGTFRGALQAATGTFSGSLSADTINAITAFKLRGQQLVFPFANAATNAITVSWIVNVQPNPETEILRVWHNPTGSPITISCSAAVRGDNCHIRLYRITPSGGASLLYQAQLVTPSKTVWRDAEPPTATVTQATVLASFGVQDTPPSGTYGYSLRIFFNEYGSASVTTRNIVGIETVRQ